MAQMLLRLRFRTSFHLLVSEDPKGAFSTSELRLADVVIFDRSTSVRTVRALPGKQAFPLSSANGELAYLDWGSVHGDVKLDANVKGEGQIATSPTYVRPSVRGAIVEWIDLGALVRRPLDLSQKSLTVVKGVGLLAPVTGQTMTVVVEADSHEDHVPRAIER